MRKPVSLLVSGVSLLLGACGHSFAEDDAPFVEDASVDAAANDATVVVAADAETDGEARGGDGSFDAGAAFDAGSAADASADASFDGGARDAASGPLGSASRFALLAATAVTVAGTPSSVTGDVGVGSPGGPIGPFVANEPTGKTYDGGSVPDAAQADVTRAYEAIEAMGACSSDHTLPASIGDMTLPPGLYCAATTLTMTGTLTLDGQDDPGATWIFRIGTTLTTAASTMLATTNRASGCNVYWAVGTTTTLGAASFFEGNILAKGAITLGAGASLLAGRALSRQDAVTLNGNDVSLTTCN